MGSKNVFGARRLLQLLAFSRLQDIDQMFDACVFACVQFVHISEVIYSYLHVLEVFRRFVSCQAASVI